jgi:hypothetical protein
VILGLLPAIGCCFWLASVRMENIGLRLPIRVVRRSNLGIAYLEQGIEEGLGQI